MWLVKVTHRERTRYLITENFTCACTIATTLKEFGYDPEGPTLVVPVYDPISGRRFVCVDGQQLWLASRSFGYEGKERACDVDGND